MTLLLRILLWILAVARLTASALAQWPEDPALNLLLADRTSEQTLPKVAVTSDGGCYVSWYDLASGNYDVYLQRLDEQGVVVWQMNGILVDGHAQESWITDYDMIVDPSDHAIIAVNDIRNGDRDIFAYRISPDGQHVWGPDGVSLSLPEANFEPDPRIAATEAGNLVFTWVEESDSGMVLHLRKLSPAGADLWNPPLVTLSQGYGVSIPRIVAAGGEQVIVEYLVQRGPNFMSPRHLFAQKFNDLGQTLWSDTGVVISDAEGIGIQVKPDIMSDDMGGAYPYWYDSRDGVHHHTFVQHILPDGSMEWTPDGVQLSLAAGQMQMPPTLVRVPHTSLLMAFYEITNDAQSQSGVGGQVVDSSGQRMWGAGGIAFVPLGTQTRYNVLAFPQAAGALVIYKEQAAGGLSSTLRGFRVNTDGLFEWDGETRTLCSVHSEKGRVAAAVNWLGQVIAAFPDGRTDPAFNLYLQNINPDGSLGAYSPPGPPTIEITQPAEGVEITALPLSVTFLVENFVVAPQGGDGVIDVAVNGTHIVWHDTTAPVSLVALAEGLNTIRLELMTYDHQPLGRPVIDSVHVIYTPSGAGPVEPALPTTLVLWPPSPNPFNSSTRLSFALPQGSDVRLVVLNILGQEVARPVEGYLPAGSHTFSFEAGNLAGGLYFCCLEAASAVQIRKLVLLR